MICVYWSGNLSSGWTKLFKILPIKGILDIFFLKYDNNHNAYHL